MNPKRGIVDLTGDKKRVQASCRKYAERKLELTEGMAEQLTRLEPLFKRMMDIELEKAKKVKLAEDKDKEVRRVSAHLVQLEEAIATLKEEVVMKQKKLKRQIDALSEKCNLNLNAKTAEEKRRVTEYFDSLKPLPKTVEEIEEKINEERGRMAASKGVGKEIEREYEGKKAEGEALEKRLEQHQELVENWSENISKMKKLWLGKLDGVVANISKNFSDFFSRLGCAGEVVIDNSEGEDNFAQYGIGINVKFRPSEQMTRLSHDRHSGGERSVATMLYMLALQELSEVPFRCVDEINQGMDAQNERTVFEMVVKLLSGSDTKKNLGKTQYFMLTPKLLPKLTFSDKMTVQIVHNGSGMVTGSQWNIKKFLEKKKART